MKKRLRVLCLIMAVAVSATMAGCSQKSSEKKETAKENDPQKLYEEAIKKFEKADMRAAETQSVTYYDDETQEEEFYTCILDSKKNIIERFSKDEDETENVYHSFNVKDKDDYGVYVNDELTDGKWFYYKEELEKGDESEYEYRLSELDLAYTEEDGYNNIEYSNEGEEELDGEKTIMVRVTADQTYDSGEESDGEVTRESVLKDYDWTEEEVKLVDGFSDILDAYVKASAETEGETTIRCALTLWINADDHTIMKSRAAQKIDSAQNEDAKEAIETFNEEYWKVDMVHQNMQDGMSAEEAKELLEEDLEAMEDPEEVTDEEASGEEIDDEDAAEDYAEVTKVVVTKKIMTGKECPQMGDLPEDYKEVTQDEYFNGGMETYEESDDYFVDDEEEFADEFE